jgi:hypothetical protein
MEQKTTFMIPTRSIALFIALMIFPTFHYGQGASKLKLGLKVAPNIGWMSPGTKGYTSDGARLGGTIGFMADFYFAENYAVTSGFNFQFLNGKLRYSDSLLVEGSPGLQDGEVFRNYNFLYFEIPLLIKMKTKQFGKFSYFGQIGLGTGFRIKATVDEHFELTKGGDLDQQYSFDQGVTLMRESLLVGIGTEFHLDESSRILIGITYSNGLNNILKGVNYKSGMDIKSLLNYAELNIGFIF